MAPPREATPHELETIAEICAGGCTQMEYADTLEGVKAASVAVFTRYISDSPGYVGRVAVVVWPGGPDLFDVFTLDGEPRVMPHDAAKTNQPTKD